MTQFHLGTEGFNESLNALARLLNAELANEKAVDM